LCMTVLSSASFSGIIKKGRDGYLLGVEEDFE